MLTAQSWVCVPFSSSATESRVRIGLVVGDHFGRVNAGERTLQCVLKQAGRANRQRSFDLNDQRTQIAQQLNRKVALLKSMGDAVVGHFFEGQLSQTILCN